MLIKIYRLIDFMIAFGFTPYRQYSSHVTAVIFDTKDTCDTQIMYNNSIKCPYKWSYKGWSYIWTNLEQTWIYLQKKTDCASGLVKIERVKDTDALFRIGGWSLHFGFEEQNLYTFVRRWLQSPMVGARVQLLTVLSDGHAKFWWRLKICHVWNHAMSSQSICYTSI